MARKADVLSIIEAAYDVDSDEQTWLTNIIEAACPHVDSGHGVSAYTWDARGGALAIRTWVDRGSEFPAKRYLEALSLATPEYVRRSWLSKSCSTASSVEGWEREPGRALLGEMGIHDVFAVNAKNPDGIGCMVGAPMSSMRRASRDEVRLFGRISAHLAAAYRLRVRLAEERVTSAVDHADAILSPSGKVEHAAEPAVESAARDALRDAVRRLERVRARGKRHDADEALAGWKGLVRARWSLLDRFERDGKRYVIALSNEAARHGLDALSSRERQVLALAALGHSNKVIAYELGLSDSTVRVLLVRVFRKLGVRTRGDAVAAWMAWASRPHEA
jgi:DNA-binding CsgD family transcriptional regulator